MRQSDLLALLCAAVIHLPRASANVEKVIFTAPESINIQTEHPTIDGLELEALTPENGVVRTRIQASVPDSGVDEAKETWLLLHGLTTGQRYEVRICWAATQPTSFWLDTFGVDTAWETPNLVTSLAAFANSRKVGDQANVERMKTSGQHEASLLFLRVKAKADYFTDNQALMGTVEPVFVDIILDPFLFNLVPRSLIPTILYTILVAAVAWAISQRIYSWLLAIPTSAKEAGKKEI